jgi:hypothetical protein
MARMRAATTLNHQPNLASEVSRVQFVAGEEITILSEWTERYFIKNSDGLVFNVPKEMVEP